MEIWGKSQQFCDGAEFYIIYCDGFNSQFSNQGIKKPRDSHAGAGFVVIFVMALWALCRGPYIAGASKTKNRYKNKSKQENTYTEAGSFSEALRKIDTHYDKDNQTYDRDE